MQITDLDTLIRKLDPYLVRRITEVGRGGGMASPSGGGGPDYLRRNGVLAMLGNLNMGGYSIVNVNLVDGVDLPSHVGNPSAHHPPVSLASPSGLTLLGQQLAVANSIAGNGLTMAAAVLAVGQGDGLEVTANAVAVRPGDGIAADGSGVSVRLATDAGLEFDGAGNLQTGIPYSLGVGTTNLVSGARHSHAIAASSNPGATGSILRTANDGSLYLDTDTLYVDAANDRVGINRAPAGAALDVIAAANADHTQRLKQKSGQTGRLWRIEDVAGDELIVLDSVGNLQSGKPGFVSGLTGWQITPTGTAEFNNVWVRGELHASIFVMDEFHASGGTLFVSPAGKLENDATIYVTTGEEWDLEVRTTGSGSGPTLTVRSTGTGTGDGLTMRVIVNFFDITDPPSGHAMIFQPGDTIRCKALAIDVGIDLWDVWGTITALEDMTDYWRYYFTRQSGGTEGLVIPAGTAVVSYGTAGDGRVLITSDQNYAPYMDVFSSGAQPWLGEITPHVRLGRLDGVGLPGVSGVRQYGMVGSTDLSNANSPYFIISNLQMAMYRITSRWNDGINDTVQIDPSGHFRIGKNIGVPEQVGFNFDPASGNLTIGHPSYPGSVTVYGQIFLPDGSPAGVVWRGAWATSTNYQVNDTVGRDGRSYICILAHTSGGSWPGTGTYWELLADKGDTGATGATGPTGPQGPQGPPGADNQDFPFLAANTAAMAGKPAGLYMVNSHLGYWNGSSFTAYIDSSGNFRFGQSGAAYIGYDASTGRLVGKNSGGTTQWYAAASDGKLYAGAGNVGMDANGLWLRLNETSSWTPNTSIRILDGGAVPVGRISTRVQSGTTYMEWLTENFIPNTGIRIGFGLAAPPSIELMASIVGISGDLDMNGGDVIDADNLLTIRSMGTVT